MRPLGVVIVDELREDRGEMLFVEHADVIETFSAERPITRSATAFAFGARIGVAIASMPIRSARARQSWP